MNTLLEVVQLVAALVVDVTVGSKCGTCGKRYFNLSLHGYVDHGDRPAPVEPSRFEARP